MVPTQTANTRQLAVAPSYQLSLMEEEERDAVTLTKRYVWELLSNLRNNEIRTYLLVVFKG